MIIRRKHTGSFAVIPNATANDDRLAADSLGVLAYLLTKPSDWTVLVADIRKRFGIGRNRVYAILKELAATGYVQRTQARTDAAKQFTAIEYVVYDMPQPEKPSVGNGDMVSPMEETRATEPQPENPVAASPEAKSGVIIEPLPENREAGSVWGNGEAASPFTVYGKRAHILKTDSTKSPSERNSAPDGAGATAPSVSAKVWKEGLDLLNALPSKPNRSIIGKWLKRTPSEEGKEKLLGMIRAAAKAGTGDPVGYVTAAINREYPPPPNPKTFDAVTWHRNHDAAIKTMAWSSAWGPPPGKKGCLMPPELITRQLTQALATRRIAA